MPVMRNANRKECSKCEMLKCTFCDAHSASNPSKHTIVWTYLPVFFFEIYNFAWWYYLRVYKIGNYSRIIWGCWDRTSEIWYSIPAPLLILGSISYGYVLLYVWAFDDGIYVFYYFFYYTVNSRCSNEVVWSNVFKMPSSYGIRFSKKMGQCLCSRSVNLFVLNINSCQFYC